MKISIKRSELSVFKYLWLFVILPKTAQFVLYIVFVLVFLNKRRIKLDNISACFIGCSLVQYIAILVQVLTGSPDAERLMAAINTSSIWIIALFFFLLIRQKQSFTTRDYSLLLKYLKTNFLILFAIYIVYRVSNRSVISIAGMSLYLRKTDYLSSGVTTRFCGLMDTVICPSHFFIIQFPLLVYLIKKTGENTWSVILWAMIGLVPVLATHSRMGEVISFAQVFLAAYFVLNDKAISKRLINAFVILCAGVVITVAIIEFPLIKNLAVAFLNRRGGSNNARLNIYLNSIARAWKESPIIGMGIKYMLGRYPYGSHSTSIGMFYKTGILGTILFVLGMTHLYHHLWDILKDSHVGKIVLFMLLFYLAFLITSDLDTTDWVTVLFFSTVGILARCLPEREAMEG